MNATYTIGLDYGTNSVRALIVNTANGREVGTAVWEYEHGTQGVILSRDPNLARQHPADYLKGAEVTIRKALAEAKRNVRGFKPEQVVGIGVDTTGSTPLPVDAEGRPLAFHKKFARNLAAMAWLWKDHTSVAEAAEITALAREIRPHYLAKCGGTYSSEWFFSKILHCLRTAPEVFEAAYTWVELADYVPAALTGTEHPDRLTVGICAAGHKAMYNDAWGGYPDEEFLGRLDPALAELRKRLRPKAYTINRSVGTLTPEWAKRTGLRAGIPVAVGAFDAHLGAVGSGITPGTLVKIIGTSTCDMMIAPLDQPLADIPGLCGIVPESILPGYYGLEAGQSAVGDIFNWFVNYIQPGGPKNGSHEALTRAAAKLKPGESGLLALDWNNGNRTILVDQRLTGLLLGQTLYTTPAEIYRALIEATAFGALTIINRFEEYGVKVEQIINCGGIAEKNPLVMQIYADVTGRPMKISRSAQTCALGAAIAGAVVAGVHKDYASAQKAMTGLKPRVFQPNPAAHEVYRQLYPLYRTLHDAFGTREWTGNLYDIMKTLLEIRNRARGVTG
ncbi:ribulokinase [Limisphaera ngatamarikiensis]|uniref:Ribulokinase n=1 Tax=Limisphaera ngatamarikiensis TaxID=1324935 RepID=A0A6M1RS49_9BACT|nr:ribulokinase [Limisphaera ngatamarikiensis]NGO40359.1 ribulokinase [Limisphaera ngatamarikiensis]